MIRVPRAGNQLELEMTRLAGGHLQRDKIKKAVETPEVANLSDEDLIKLVEWLCDYLQTNGPFVPGILRVSPTGFSKDGFLRLCVAHPELLDEQLLLINSDCHAIAGALKDLLRLCACSPILGDFGNASLADCLGSLQPVQRRLLHRVALLLQALSQSRDTKMTEQTLATCLAPNLYREHFEGESVQEISASAVKQNEQLADLIRNLSSFFPEPYERLSEPKKAAESSLFLSPKEWHDLTSMYCLIVSVEKGDVLLEAGKPNSNLYRVRSGEYHMQIDNETLSDASLGAGSLFGQFSVFDSGSRQEISIVCAAPGEVFCFRASDLIRLTSADPTLASRLYSHLAVHFAAYLSQFLGRSSQDNIKGVGKLRQMLYGDSPSSSTTPDTTPDSTLETSWISSSASLGKPRVFRAKAHGLWGDVIISPGGISHHGHLLGVTRSTFLAAEQMTGNVIHRRDETIEIITVNVKNTVKFTFKKGTADAFNFEEAVKDMFTPAETDLNALKMSQAGILSDVNEIFVSKVLVDFQGYGEGCLDCSRGEKVWLTERRGTWAFATTVGRTPNESGWVPMAIVDGSEGVVHSEQAVLTAILGDDFTVERTLQPNEKLLQEHDASALRALMYLSSGTLHIEAETGFSAILFPDEVIGEARFLRGTAPAASVSAGPDGAVVQIIRPKQIERFIEDPTNASHFYRFMCVTLARRARNVYLGAAQTNASIL